MRYEIKMLDVFKEETEVLIKNGIANLYWYRDDLKKALIRCNINNALVQRLYDKVDATGKKITKRQMMDELYASGSSAQGFAERSLE